MIKARENARFVIRETGVTGGTARAVRAGCVGRPGRVHAPRARISVGTTTIRIQKLSAMLLLSVFVALCSCGALADPTPRTPNVVIFFVDDWGWGDLGANCLVYTTSYQ